MPVTVSDATLIVNPERAVAQRSAEAPTSEGEPEPGIGHVATHGNELADERGPVEQPGPGQTRYFGSKRLHADRYASDFKKLAEEILAPLGATPGVTVNVTIEIEATAPQGFDDSKVRTVSENAATLNFEQSGFEDA